MILKNVSNLLRLCILCCFLMVFLWGCNETTQEKPLDKAMINAELIHTLNDTAVQNAVIAQHILYPYHFINNSNTLNELGQRELKVLASHFIENPGQLNIRKSNTPGELYESRVLFVIGKLNEQGVDVNRISISDGMPGGSGMSSEKVLMILEEESETSDESQQQTSTTGGRSRY